MSASLSALGFGAFAGNEIASLLLRPSRAIGTLIPDCVFTEDHMDALQITEHPVEKTADITDHAYLKPKEVTIRFGFSNASLGPVTSLVTSAISGSLSLSSALGTLTDGIGGDSYAVQSYNKLLAIQASKQPIAITTGKRKYTSMLIQTIAVHTDAQYEYSLMATVHCKEIILVSTFSTSLPPNANQAQAQTTASPQSTGTQSPAATTNFDSILKGGSGYLGSLIPSFGGGK
jgi:hypothetical protein